MSTNSAASNKRSHEGYDTLPSTAKKPRQGDAGGRDEEFWADDGNVVLVARNVEFRVHKSVLAYHSPVFADMFSLPQPADAFLETSHNCPVVHLDDSPEDLRHVLSAILPRKTSKLVGSKDYNPTFDTISAYARLGHKYQIEHLVTQTVEFLKGHYTHSFHEWEMNEDFQPAGWQRTDAIGVVNMARLLGCHSVLPSALAVCCMLDPFQLLDGFQREDGSRETLDKSDLICCLRGKEILSKESVSAVDRAFMCNPPKPQPCKRQPCSPWLDVLVTARLLYPDAFGGAHVIDDWRNRLDDAAAGDKTLCKSCFASLASRLRDEQQKIWDRLPELLNVQVAG